MNRVKLLRYGSGLVLLFLIFVFQTTFAKAIDIRGIAPNLIVITVVSFALLRGNIEGAVAGAALGMLQDMFYGDVIGFYTVIYMHIGFATGYLHMNFYKDSVLIPIGVIAGADIYNNLVVYFFTFLFRGALEFHHYLGQIIIPELIYTLFAGFLLYRLFYMINAAIEKVEWSKEYENR